MVPQNPILLIMAPMPDSFRLGDLILPQDGAGPVAFNLAKGAIPARTDADFSALDACAQATAADFSASDTAGTAVPTFAGTHAAQASVVGAATDVITEFFNTDMTPEEAAEQLAEAVELAL